MNKVAIAFLSKDRVELTRQSIEPLKQPDKFDLFWFDGSTSKEGIAFTEFPLEVHTCFVNVGGGPGVAIIKALIEMLRHPNKYTHVGLVENDVLLDADWFEPTMALFDCIDTRQPGCVGAVSARCYEDRILIQRDGYAVCHNLGAGQIIFTRKAAELVIENFRGGFTLDNRKVFQRLSGIDIGSYWAFRENVHFLTADWHWDTVLAAHGYCSLALTPSKCEMIGQDPPLEQQGLKLADGKTDKFKDKVAYEKFFTGLFGARLNWIDLGVDVHFQTYAGITTLMPHQLAAIHGEFSDGWGYRDNRGCGPFEWVAQRDDVYIDVFVSGRCEFQIIGGDKDATVYLHDDKAPVQNTGPFVIPRMMNKDNVIVCTAADVLAQRKVRFVTKTSGLKFLGLRVHGGQVQFARTWETVAGFFDGCVVG